ncbi:NAD(P)H-binding protein [Amycolatopsis saalfeldensis]|uniref:Uncharacterized conserved protein YbjT, contains NAD(P)-binding and DUF2867 domains n=1 Tax=Amycolatopsis saalfeldensis TaxID=394193 RepID=A0A1H8YFM1_9PSEU|nr:NAD(P)H-binding protein [Amycolatopsis saalfeldensis]SEP50907.1 Uncharacterized conserved protein YbjT, contains NAD(P)-binding and DUF2867 domains [Amycolatopsis saalfeldensis]
MIVVTGATGNVGRPLVAALAAAGAQVTAVSRSKPAEWPSGIAHRRADLAEPEGLRPVLDGADALFLFPQGPADALVDVAKAGGVRRIVLLSSQGAGTRPGAYAHFAGFERAVRNSGLAWTVLRPGGFATNTLAWQESIRVNWTAAAPFGDVALPFVDPADVAEVAAKVLLGDGHAGRVYELTGPAPLTPRERAHAIGEALGVAVRFLDQSPADARAEMAAQVPGPIADATLAVLGDPLPAERRVSPDVERILGRPARSFAEWAARSAAAFE